ncbi:hypothetical protein [Bradyrhizobium sp. LHD-71]|uniref:hypothetical protein n=1 Tax=Bradyrhizobium sp. LHD-71 TaxID=3072141 RepID=UPI002810903D|nr:hypothetical protein [Bradyrhizobium sp. LHD-71]MDQ8732407.1 hypothetical protein [Bradyrhizobium sp. LHD-71]
MQPLSDHDEVLFRQIHPGFVEDGVPSSQPFRPTPKDQNKLSVDRSSAITPEASFTLFQENGGATIAVYGLSVGDFASEAIICHPDPLPELNNPAHAIADYSPHKTSQHKTIAKRLKRLAIARGCFHPRASTKAEEKT